MAKRVPPLSATKLAKFKPDAVKVLELVDGAVPGLRVRLTPAGTRSWSLNIRANGKMRRFDVGRGLGLAEARLKAEELRHRVKEGEDPTAEKRTSRLKTHLTTQGIGTLDSILDTYFTKGRCSLIYKRRSAAMHSVSFFNAPKTFSFRIKAL